MAAHLAIDQDEERVSISHNGPDEGIVNPGNNTLAETLNGLYKTELIYKRASWKTREAVELAPLEWMPWFNHQHLLEPFGYIPPAEAEAQYYRQLTNTESVCVT